MGGARCIVYVDETRGSSRRNLAEIQGRGQARRAVQMVKVRRAAKASTSVCTQAKERNAGRLRTISVKLRSKGWRERRIPEQLQTEETERREHPPSVGVVRGNNGGIWAGVVSLGLGNSLG